MAKFKTAITYVGLATLVACLPGCHKREKSSAVAVALPVETAETEASSPQPVYSKTDGVYEVYWDTGDRICLLASDAYSMDQAISIFEGQIARRVVNFRPFGGGVIADMKGGSQEVLWYKKIDCEDPPYDPLSTTDSLSPAEKDTSNGRRPAAANNRAEELWMGSTQDRDCELASSGSVATTPNIPVSHGEARLERRSADGNVAVISSRRIDNGQKFYMIFASTKELCQREVQSYQARQGSLNQNEAKEQGASEEMTGKSQTRKPAPPDDEG